MCDVFTCTHKGMTNGLAGWLDGALVGWSACAEAKTRAADYKGPSRGDETSMCELRKGYSEEAYNHTRTTSPVR